MAERGFVQLIIIIVLLVVIVSLLGVSLTSLFNNKTLRGNFSLLGQGMWWVWADYIKPWVAPAWNYIVSFLPRMRAPS